LGRGEDDLRDRRSAGAYSAKCKPAKKGAYRMRATIPAPAAHTAATTVWLAFTAK